MTKETADLLLFVGIFFIGAGTMFVFLYSLLK